MTGISHALLSAESLFYAQGANFDGTNDYMTRGSDLTGLADGKVGTLSAWVKFNGGNGSVQDIIRSGGGFFEVRKEAANTITVTGTNSAASVILLLTSSTTYTSSSGWLHILASWNLASAFGKLYVNGSDVTAGGATLTNDTIDYTQTDWSVGASPVGGNKANADFAELYFNSVASIDITTAANRGLFRSGAGKPANIAANGSYPTGSQPIVYLKGPASSFPTNIGSGGNFSVTGTLTDSSTSPSL